MTKEFKIELEKSIALLSQIIDKKSLEDSILNDIEIGESWDIYHLKEVLSMLKALLLKLKVYN